MLPYFGTFLSRPHFLRIENTVNRNKERVKEAGKKGENDETRPKLNIIGMARIKSEYHLTNNQNQ